MGSPLTAQVRAANALTERWSATFAAGDAVVSGAGLWPLLAVLAGAAGGGARAELADAVGVRAEDAHPAGLELLRALDESREVSTAIGTWVRPGLELRPEWVHSMPVGTVGVLGDQAVLDAWARDHTHGLIERFPLRVTPETVLAVATALVARTQWVQPFEPREFAPETGPWQGHRGPGLRRFSRGDRSVSILGEDVTRVVVTGRGEFDVHLLISADGPRRGLAAGIAALDDAIAVRTDPPVDSIAPCLTVRRVESWGGGNGTSLILPPFEVRSAHDLTDQAALFGLTTALDGSRGHFPGLSDTPLALNAAAQHVLARFDATGFEAAAVTAVAMAVAGMPRKQWSTITSVTIDRPFGFLAVDRASGLVLVAGQVTEPPRDRVRPATTESARARFPGPPP
ncbi:serpin family protein [Nocardia mangyaensis]|uniref:serpin family protein n=1 Tax=Nocardia mangyaensis TaxID=2213200 RepID=UPI002674A712|nr:serpin family protein [Nocardia mangyaensis]MDO3646717.1 serpin family protein [Nocardia mangyaensis]